MNTLVILAFCCYSKQKLHLAIHVKHLKVKTMERTVRITEVLRNHNFLKLWIGQIVSAMGDRLHQMALLGLIMRKGGNVGEELSKITFWSVLPFFLFSLFSGVLSDRWSRKSILIGSTWRVFFWYALSHGLSVIPLTLHQPIP